MARIRTLKPDMQKDRALAKCSRDARHLFTGLITQADDEGREDADPRLLRAAWYPLDDDVTNEMVSAWIEELEIAGLVKTYEIGDVTYYELPGFVDNQVINRPKPSKIPAPPVNPASGLGAVPVTDGSVTPHGTIPREGKGEEGIGMEDIYNPASGSRTGF